MSPPLVLVTGAGGFLGAAITRQALARGWRVRGFFRGAYPALEAEGLQACRGDLVDAERVAAAAEGCDLVFHVAAKAGAWGPARAYEDTNVRGTENVLAACRRQGVPHLVHTSTPSVVSCGEDLEGVDETRAMARRFTAHYPRTKALAEQAVRDADSPTLRTVALRPHLVWGPGDGHLLPRLVARRRAGRLRRITTAGAAEKRIDTTYIDDAARAHLLAAQALRGGLAGRVGGRAYFISSGQPIGVWTMIDRLLDAADLPPVEGRVSPGRARLAGILLEALFHALRIDAEPPLTRWVAAELSTAHWFDIGAARRDLGYEPQVDLDTGMARLKEWWRSIERA